MKSSTSWDVGLYSPVKVNHCFEGTYCLHLQCQRLWLARNRQQPLHPAGFSLSLLLALKMEAMCSSEMSVDLYQTTQHYIPKDLSLSLSLSHPPTHRGVGPLANYADRATAAFFCEVVPTFADRGCCVVSATDPPGR
jgi:hypothetical protein